MPNWCYNTLVITGKPKAIHKLVKQVKDDESVFSFEKIIPMPESEKDNWYKWRVENWQTKWNADVQYNTFDQWEGGQIEIDFNTAWDMPLPIFKELSKQHPTLWFEAKGYEESWSFWYAFGMQNGNCKWESQGEFKNCAEFNDFGVTHHECLICKEWIDECDNSDKREIVCTSCKDKEKEIDELDKELWEGELNETNA